MPCDVSLNEVNKGQLKVGSTKLKSIIGPLVTFDYVKVCNKFRFPFQNPSFQLLFSMIEYSIEKEHKIDVNHY
jgi:hypothetical protein